MSEDGFRIASGRLHRVVYETLRKQMGEDFFVHRGKSYSVARLANSVVTAILEDVEEDLDVEASDLRRRVTRVRQLLKDVIEGSSLDVWTLRAPDQRWLAHDLRLELDEL